MTAWSSGELIRIGRAEELHVASLRREGTMRDSRVVWVVREGDDPGLPQ